jgi:hypothetical protein
MKYRFPLLKALRHSDHLGIRPLVLTLWAGCVESEVVVRGTAGFVAQMTALLPWSNAAPLRSRRPYHRRQVL